MIKFELRLYALDTVRMAISSRRSFKYTKIFLVPSLLVPICVFFFDVPFHVALLSYQLIVYQFSQHQQLQTVFATTYLPIITCRIAPSQNTCQTIAIAFRAGDNTTMR